LFFNGFPVFSILLSLLFPDCPGKAGGQPSGLAPSSEIKERQKRLDAGRDPGLVRRKSSINLGKEVGI